MNLLESPLCAAARLDSSGMVQQVSPGVRLVLGLAPSSLLGKAFEDTLSAEDRRSWGQARDRVLNGAPFGVLAVTLRSGGAVVLRLAADGDGLVVVLEESSEDHKARGDSSLVRALLEFNGSMGLAHDLSGRLVDVSEGLCTQSGYAREELVGNHLSMIEKTLRPGQTDGLWHRIQPGKTTVSYTHLTLPTIYSV